MKPFIKQLKPTTIIPKHLYVERDADRQLRIAIDEMGRPAYVLVARQMGKTNLLLNAKRELETEEDIFVFVDLSNSFSCATDCFRGIIDTAIETHQSVFHSATERLQADREAQKLPPNKEHESELRTLLRYVRKRMVIILDEIDALSNAPFSDQVFALIRSIYFSRANFPEFERLTYVLSGVAEPSEIIKNPKVSPFNIGQKIYLDDFSYDEVQIFLQKVGLILSSETIARIIYWANGNPRITWEICSEIEDRIIQKKEISPSDVDGIVKRLYLTQFDRPPVDHIRNLVADDRDIRNAIIEIRYGKGATLSDLVRNRMYLAGIINSNFLENPVIKNKIVDSSLSEQWINEIEKSKKGSFNLARERYTEGYYSQAVPLFEEYLLSTNANKDDINIAQYMLGLCYFNIGNYEKAQAHLQKELLTSIRSQELRYELTYFIGMTSYYLRHYEESIKMFSHILEQGSNTPHYWESIVNLAGSYYQQDFLKNRAEIDRLNNEVISSIDNKSNNLDMKVISNLKVAAHFNLGKMYEREQNISKARTHFEQAAAVAGPIDKAGLLAILLSLDTDIDRRKNTLQAYLDALITADIVPNTAQKDRPIGVTLEDHWASIICSVELSEPELTEKLIEYIVTHSSEFNIRSRVLYAAGMHAWRTNRISVSVTLLLNAFKDIKLNNSDTDLLWHISRILVNFPDHIKYHILPIFEEYLNTFKEFAASSQINLLDFNAFANQAQILLSRKKYAEAINLLGIIESRCKEESNEHKVNFLVIDFLVMQAYIGLRHNKLAEERAEKIMNCKFSLDSSVPGGSLLDNKGLESIKRQAALVLAPFQDKANPPVVRQKKIGRNDLVRVRFQDGSIKEMKLKKALTIPKTTGVILLDNDSAASPPELDFRSSKRPLLNEQFFWLDTGLSKKK